MIIQLADMNAAGVLGVGIDELLIGFDALDIAKGSQPVKKEAITAADVEDLATGSSENEKMPSKASLKSRRRLYLLRPDVRCSRWTGMPTWVKPNQLRRPRR